MGQYRVKVRTTGVLRVEADSPGEAERMAREAPVRMAGCKLFEADTGAETVGEVERTSIQPEDVESVSGLGDL